MNLETSRKGFTIVELLIVIVVIAILATISIVAYTGIQDRARTSSAQTAASNSIKKIELYYVDYGSYPSAPSILTGAAATDTFKLDSVSFVSNHTSGPSNPAAVIFQRCGVRTAGNNTAPSALSEVATITGARIGYWNWQESSIRWLRAGTAIGTVGTQTVACFTTAS